MDKTAGLCLGLLALATLQGHHLLIQLRTSSWRKTKPTIYCVIPSCIMERHTVWYAVIQEKDAWFQRKLPSFDIFILCDVWNILASKHFRGNQFHLLRHIQQMVACWKKIEKLIILGINVLTYRKIISYEVAVSYAKLWLLMKVLICFRQHSSWYLCDSLPSLSPEKGNINEK